jgi:phage FluMu protein Com
MASAVTKKCPNCGKIMVLPPEAAKIGVVCPNCKTFSGEKKDKLSDEEIRKVSRTIKELFRK